MPHGAMNALSLPQALRFNEPVAGEEIARFGEAMGTDDPIGRVEELARLGGFERLRDFGVPENELDEVAEATGVRPGARANPRPATPPHSSSFCALVVAGLGPSHQLFTAPTALTSSYEQASSRSDGLTPAGGARFLVRQGCFHSALKTT